MAGKLVQFRVDTDLEIDLDEFIDRVNALVRDLAVAARANDMGLEAYMAETDTIPQEVQEENPSLKRPLTRSSASRALLRIALTSDVARAAAAEVLMVTLSVQKQAIGLAQEALNDAFSTLVDGEMGR